MQSTHSFCSNEVEFYRRSDQRGMSLGHSPSLGDQYDTNSHFSTSNSPQSDAENKNAPPRKRVPVACGRCRKRKIKCSGDEGGNRGCSNCRNAGYAGCQFLRVQSSELPMGVQYQSLKGWQMSHRYSPYSSGAAHRFKFCTSSQYADSPAYDGLPAVSNYDPYQTAATSCAWVRPSYAPHYGLTYSEESASHYSAQPPPNYMLPNTNSMNNVNSCYMKNNLGRVQQTGLWSDPETSNSVVSASGGHMNSNYGLHDSAPFFHAVNTSSADRTLPTPSSSRTLAAAPQSSLDTQCLSALSHRSSLGWNTETPSSTSGASSRTSNSTDPESRVVSAGPFGYINISSNMQELADTTAGTEMPHSSDDVRLASDDGLVRVGSRDSQGQGGQPPTDTINYPYTSSKSSRSSQSTSSRLVSGQAYHSVPISTNTQGSIQEDCSPNLQSLTHGDIWQAHSQRSSGASLSTSLNFSNIH